MVACLQAREENEELRHRLCEALVARRFPRDDNGDSEAGTEWVLSLAESCEREAEAKLEKGKGECGEHCCAQAKKELQQVAQQQDSLRRSNEDLKANQEEMDSLQQAFKRNEDALCAKLFSLSEQLRSFKSLNADLEAKNADLEAKRSA